jgi:hypothetical protein
MSFNESNTVEQMILDAATSLGSGAGSSVLREDPPAGWGGSLGEEFKPSRWTYVAATALPRQPGEVMVEPWVREALISLNPEIAEQPDRADEVIYALRAILLSVQGDGLVRANENFMAWLRGEKTMPFGPNGEHVAVRLVDFTQPGKNRLTVTNQWTYQTGSVVKRFDVVFLVNGLPLVIGEAKTPTRSAVTWFDGAHQVSEIYEKEIPAMFVPNVFSFATEGRGCATAASACPSTSGGRGAMTTIRTKASCAMCARRWRACCGPAWCWTSCKTSPSSPRTRSTGASR